MATPPQATMMREISAAGDRERTGVIDVDWDVSHASLFFMFGHPSHAVFTSEDGRSLVGDDALNALVHELPSAVRVAPWRRAMVPEDTLHLTADELLQLFPSDRGTPRGEDKAAPSNPDGPDAVSFERETTAPADVADPTQDDVLAGPLLLAGPAPIEQAAAASGFPLLPLDAVLWADEMANLAGLAEAVPRLPDSLLVLSAPGHEAAALVAGGAVVDAVSVADNQRLIGEAAAQALMDSPTGVLTAHRIGDSRLPATLPLLWRAERAPYVMPASWWDTAGLLTDAAGPGGTCAVVLESSSEGVALFYEGELIAAYTADERAPSTTVTLLHRLLNEQGAQLLVAAGAERPQASDERPEAAVQLDTGDEQGAIHPLALEPVSVAEADPQDAPAIFSIPTLVDDEERSPAEDIAAIPEGADFVAPRLEVDFAALRAELNQIAVRWLTADDAAAATAAIDATPPGVAHFVSTIAAIGVRETPGHQRAVIRAMAREMHYRASEVLCGV